MSNFFLTDNSYINIIFTILVSLVKLYKKGCPKTISFDEKIEKNIKDYIYIYTNNVNTYYLCKFVEKTEHSYIFKSYCSLNTNDQIKCIDINNIGVPNDLLSSRLICYVGSNSFLEIGDELSQVIERYLGYYPDLELPHLTNNFNNFLNNNYQNFVDLAVKTDILEPKSLYLVAEYNRENDPDISICTSSFSIFSNSPNSIILKMSYIYNQSQGFIVDVNDENLTVFHGKTSNNYMVKLCDIKDNNNEEDIIKNICSNFNTINV